MHVHPFDQGSVSHILSLAQSSPAQVSPPSVRHGQPVAPGGTSLEKATPTAVSIANLSISADLYFQHQSMEVGANGSVSYSFLGERLSLSASLTSVWTESNEDGSTTISGRAQIHIEFERVKMDLRVEPATPGQRRGPGGAIQQLMREMRAATDFGADRSGRLEFGGIGSHGSIGAMGNAEFLERLKELINELLSSARFLQNPAGYTDYGAQLNNGPKQAGQRVEFSLQHERQEISLVSVSAVFERTSEPVAEIPEEAGSVDEAV